MQLCAWEVTLADAEAHEAKTAATEEPEGEEENHHCSCGLHVALGNLPWAVHHSETTEVAIAQSKKDHEDEGPSVAVEPDFAPIWARIAHQKEQEENYASC